MEFDASPLVRDLERALARYTQWEHPLRRYRALNYARLNKGGYTWEEYQSGLADLENGLRAKFDPRTQLHPLFAQLCAAYLAGDDTARRQIRALVAQRKTLGNLLWRYANRLAGDIASAPADAQVLLELTLAALAIENCGANYRDAQMTLADLYVAAEQAGVDPRASFEAAAERAADELTPGGCTSLARMIGEFPACTVLAERRALGEPYGGPT